jgi:hypothetical protein
VGLFVVRHKTDDYGMSREDAIQVDRSVPVVPQPA